MARLTFSSQQLHLTETHYFAKVILTLKSDDKIMLLALFCSGVLRIKNKRFKVDSCTEILTLNRLTANA